MRGRKRCKLVVERSILGVWKVSIGKRSCDRLTPDEALWVVAAYLMEESQGFIPYLQTAEQRLESEAKLAIAGKRRA